MCEKRRLSNSVVSNVFSRNSITYYAKQILNIDEYNGIDDYEFDWEYFNNHHRVRIVLDLEQMGKEVLTSPMQQTSLIKPTRKPTFMIGDSLANFCNSHFHTFPLLLLLPPPSAVISKLSAQL
jgi:hypothetical protein